MMNWYYKLSLRMKILLGSFMALLITIVISLVGLFSIAKINNTSKAMYENCTKPMMYLSQIQSDVQQVHIACLNMVNATSQNEKQTYQAQIGNLFADFNTNTTNFRESVSSEKIKQPYNTFTKSIADFSTGVKELIDTSTDGSTADAKALLNGNMKEATDTEEAAIKQMMFITNSEAMAANEKNAQMVRGVTIAIIIIMAAGILITLLAGFLLSNLIGKSMDSLLDVAEKISNGDLDVEVKEIKMKDEVGRLADAFRGMLSSLNQLMAGIRSSAGQVAAGSKQISASSQELSQGTAEQASSVQELTASIEEISSQTHQTAENVNKASKLSAVLKTDAQQSNEHMKQTLEAMKNINVSSSNISKIVKAIDDIAFQTNILALNAAVEAAHAGQYGKGFAVVAEEVRNLATKSAKAASDTTALIENSISTAESGAKIVANTAESLDKMVERISMVAQLGNEISTASDEQAAGLAQINIAIQQVSEVIQANSATSEEGAAASEELSGQAEILKDMVDKFKLSEDKITYTEVMDGELSDDVSVAEKLEEKKTGSENQKSEEINIELGDQDFGKYAKK